MFSKVTSVFDQFKKPADPKDLVRKWQSELRSEQRGMERQIRDLAREEKLAQKNVRMILTFFLLFHMLPSLDLAERREKIKKTNLFFYPLPPPPPPPPLKKKQVRDAAKRGDAAGAKTLAREIVRCRAATSRLYVHKARLVDMNSRLAEQLGTARVAGSLQKSAEVMALVNGLVKVPQLMGTMRAMSREMARAGMIDEMVGDAIDGAVAEEGEDEAAEAEVDKVLMEIAGADMESLAAAAAPRTKQRIAAQEAAAPTAEEEEGMEDLKARLEAVRN